MITIASCPFLIHYNKENGRETCADENAAIFDEIDKKGMTVCVWRFVTATGTAANVYRFCCRQDL